MSKPFVPPKPSHRTYESNFTSDPEIISDNSESETSNYALNSCEYMESERLVGFSNLPDQIFRRIVHQGFEFNLMIVGESGLGKSTFINTFLNAEIYNEEFPGPSKRSNKTMRIETHSFLLEENDISLRLNIIDTPGFGDSVDNTGCWNPILEYLNSCFDGFMIQECKVNRDTKTIADNRIHACIYFISPTGHSLKQLDIEVLSRLQHKVNIIPVIAKADTLTIDECIEFKKSILSALAENNISIYQFPDGPEFTHHKIEDMKKIASLCEKVPFAVIGSKIKQQTTLHYAGKSTTKMSCTRTYPWGVAEVENLAHNDLTALRQLMMNVFLNHLRQTTDELFYANHRSARLLGSDIPGQSEDGGAGDALLSMSKIRGEQDARMLNSRAEFDAVLQSKITEKMKVLKELEVTLTRKNDELSERIRSQQVELDARKKVYEEELAKWNQDQQAAAAVTSANPQQSTVSLGDHLMTETSPNSKAKNVKKKRGLF